MKHNLGFTDPDGTRWPACDRCAGTLVDIGAGVQLWTAVEGGGPPLMLIHGGPGVDHRSLHPGLSILSETKQLVYYDLRGHYLSPPPVGLAHLGLETDSRDLEALRLALRLGTVDVFGHSYGGMVALAYAGMFPGSVRSVVVCSTPLGSSEDAIQARMTTDPASVAMGGLPEDAPAEERDAAYLRFYFHLQPAPEVARYALLARDGYNSARTQTTLAAREQADSSGEPDWDPLISGASCPVLMLYGAHDPIVSGDDIRRTVVGRSNYEVVRFDHSRHDPFHDEPQRFRDVVSGFLSDLPSA